MKKNGKYCSKKSMNMKPLAVLLAMVLLVGCAIGGTLAWLTANSTTVTNTFTESDINITLDEDKPTGQTAKMVPGHYIDKDPWVTVTEDSEDCYLFVKVTENGGNVTVDNEPYGFNNFIAYKVKTGEGYWTPLNADKYPGVYYKVIDTAAERVDGKKEAVKHYILGAGEETYDGTKYTWKDNQVLTVPTVTKEMMNAFDTDKNGTLSAEEKENLPTLSFDAYAVQLWKTNKPGTGATAEQIKDAQFTAEEAWMKTPGYVAPTPTP